MPFVKVWIHSVWGTKNHIKVLSNEIKPKLFQHIKENAKKKKMYVDFINGYLDHVHCLMTLNADTPITKTMQFLKGESAHWANEVNLINSKFEWADEYFAVSVSESMIDKVRNYIKNQDEHHKHETFSQEYEKFIRKYGFHISGLKPIG